MYSASASSRTEPPVSELAFWIASVAWAWVTP